MIERSRPHYYPTYANGDPVLVDQDRNTPHRYFNDRFNPYILHHHPHRILRMNKADCQHWLDLYKRKRMHTCNGEKIPLSETRKIIEQRLKDIKKAENDFKSFKIFHEGVIQFDAGARAIVSNLLQDKRDLQVAMEAFSRFNRTFIFDTPDIFTGQWTVQALKDRKHNIPPTDEHPYPRTWSMSEIFRRYLLDAHGDITFSFSDMLLELARSSLVIKSTQEENLRLVKHQKLGTFTGDPAVSYELAKIKVVQWDDFKLPWQWKEIARLYHIDDRLQKIAKPIYFNQCTVDRETVEQELNE